jgi:hypothetical protein
MVNQMIVKVQISLATTHDKATVLIYNQSRRVFYEGEADADVLAKMNGRQKAFFAASLNGTIVELGEMVKDYKW